MSIKVRCPKNNSHNQFITVAHVVEEWVVDKKGNWITTLGSLETSVPPNKDNGWACYFCGEEAIVED
ncbi:MAG: hypothetical protein DRI65_04400 [Chloroflexota bacterium]|nr:MAG: hypothetical protein DRI65_04400 [Chloroflexota bacterium]